jgi:hypothetical protein
MLNLEMNNPTFDNVKKQARHHWVELLIAAGIDAKALRNVHGPCPGCGGKDRFRFDDHDGNGTFICSQGNGDNLSGDGFELLQHAGLAADPKSALALVARHLAEVLPPEVFLTKTSKYVYRCPDGQDSLIVLRVDKRDGSKTFRQQLPNGKLPRSDADFLQHPYRINEWPSDGLIILCEGEKCADALWGLGFAATTRAGGSSKWDFELTPYFGGRHVVILPDNDSAGLIYAQKVIDALLGTVASLKVCELPDLPEKGDVIDWLDAGGTKETLSLLIEHADDAGNWRSGGARRHAGLSLSDLKAIKIERRDPLHDLLPPGFTLMAGAPKIGKSKLAEFIAGDVAQNNYVLYLALEYNQMVAQTRFNHLDDSLDIEIFLEGGFPRWDQGGAEKLESLLSFRQPKLVVLDTLARLKRPGQKNDYEAETQAMQQMKIVTDKYNCDVLALHHLRKSGVNDNKDDPFERILGSTALAAAVDNLQILLTSGDERVLHTKGRIVFPSEKLLKLDDNRFVEQHSALGHMPINATTQTQVLHIIARQGEMKVSDLTVRLEKAQSNISRVCANLVEKGKLIRLENGAYSLPKSEGW